MTGSPNTEAPASSTISDILGVVTDAQTYLNILYLGLAFPLGLIYYTVVLTGFTLGLGLSVFVVGLGIFVGTVIGLRYIASFERKLANVLLGTAIAESDDVTRDGDGIIATTKAYLQAASTWRGLAFVMLKFWLGLLAFILLVSFLGAGIDLTLLPLAPDGIFNVQVANWTIAESFETTIQRTLAVPVGLLLVLLSFHILNALARANDLIASSLLGPSDEQSKSE